MLAWDIVSQLWKFIHSLNSLKITEHPWIREDGDASDEPMDITVIARMRQFTATNKLKKVALKVTDICQFILIYLLDGHLFSCLIVKLIYALYQVIAEDLSEEEIIGLKEIFKSMDTDCSGTITFDELKAGLSKWGSKLSDSEVRQLMESV